MAIQEIIFANKINVLMYDSYKEYITAIDSLLEELRNDPSCSIYQCSDQIISDLNSEAWCFWHKVLDTRTEWYRANCEDLLPSAATRFAVFEIYIMACEWERLERLKSAFVMIEIAETFRDKCLDRYINWQKPEQIF